VLAKLQGPWGPKHASNMMWGGEGRGGGGGGGRMLLWDNNVLTGAQVATVLWGWHLALISHRPSSVFCHKQS
jgi:hypothetical protein